MVTCNTTLEDSYIKEDPLFGNVTFHHFGLLLSAIFGLISIVVSLVLIMNHAIHYLKPNEQKHIIRILFMIPVYSTVAFLSFIFYRHAVYFQVLGNCYEAFAISSFFTLLCSYIAPTLHDQKDYFRSITPKNWFLEFFYVQRCTGGQNKGPLRVPRSGLTWFNIIWVGIYQYCAIRVFFTFVAVITEHFRVYCEESLNPAFAHIWVVVCEALSVTIAMTMVIQFYIQLKDDLAEHRPLLKVLSIKLVIFLSFWQTILLSFLASTHGPIKATSKIAYQDVKVGIPNLILCLEMALFSILHVFAYPVKPYNIKHSFKDPLTASGSGYSGDVPRYQGGPFGLKALLDAANPWDIIKAGARGFRWLFVGYWRREVDVSYQPTKLGAGTAYTGPTFAGNGEMPTELGSGYGHPRRGRGEASAYIPEDDRAGLLLHSQGLGRVATHSPYRNDSTDDFAQRSDLHLPAGHPPGTISPGAHGLDFQLSNSAEDTGYHPALGSSPPDSVHPPGTALPGPGDTVHPAYRPGPDPNWNHWGGASDAHSIDRPPTYRTNDPRR